MPYVSLKDKLFQEVQFGEKVPAGAIKGGGTQGDDIYYIGRSKKGEIGKYNLLKGKVNDLWCHDEGRSRSDNEILVLPADGTMTYKWEAYKRGNPLPPDAFHAGWNKKDGALYVGKAKGSIGKMTTSNGKTSGNMHDLWIDLVGCATTGHILTITEKKIETKIIDTVEFEIKPFLLSLFEFDNNTDTPVQHDILDVIGFTEKKLDSPGDIHSVQIAMDVADDYAVPYGFIIKPKDTTNSIWTGTNSQELSTTKTAQANLEFPGNTKTEHYRWALRFKGGQVASLVGSTVIISEGKNFEGKTKEELEQEAGIAVLESWDGGYEEF